MLDGFKRLMNERRMQKMREQIEEFAQTIKQEKLDAELEANKNRLAEMFERVNTFNLRDVTNERSGLKFTVAYMGGMIDNRLIADAVLRPLMDADISQDTGNLGETLMREVICGHNIKEAERFDDLASAVTYGDTAVLLPEGGKALIVSSQGFSLRGISEPDSEKILSGPREGFNESLIGNISMLYRKLRTNRFKTEGMTIGRLTGTQLSICYIDGLADNKILEEVKRRLRQIEIDGVLDSNYLTELISDQRFSLFRSIGSTERPDIVVAKLLEGRIAILVDGSPVALTLPYLFIENLHSNEDYYGQFYFASFARILRIIAFFLTTTLPGFYICVTSFHYEVLPTPLLFNIASERQNVPFPAALEAFLMLIVFDILRETGIRMQASGGQALSIVGALVIGQSAVEARLVSAQMIIIVALTGITNLSSPKLNTPSIFIRLSLLFCASALGIHGMMIGVSAFLIYVLKLQSAGLWQIDTAEPDIKDLAVRAHWSKMQNRPAKLSKNRRRLRIKE